MPSPGNVMGMSADGVGFTQSGQAVSPANALASFRFLTDGFVESAPTNNVFAQQFRWLTGAGTPGQYYVSVTPTSGSFSSSAAGSGVLIDLSATRTWARNRTNDAAGTTRVTATVNIYGDSAGARLLASFVVILNATVVV